MLMNASETLQYYCLEHTLVSRVYCLMCGLAHPAYFCQHAPYHKDNTNTLAMVVGEV